MLPIATSILRNLNDFGIVVEDQTDNLHSDLVTQPSGKGRMCLIAPDGSFEITDYYEAYGSLMYLIKGGSNHHSGLLAKVNESGSSLLKKLGTMVELCEPLLDGSENIQALTELCRRMSLWDDAARAKLAAEAQALAVDSHYYLAFELSDYEKYPCPVQSDETIRAMSDALFAEAAKQETDELDLFGNPANGSDKAFPPGPYCLSIFKRYETRLCHNRFGMNGSASCKLGARSRNRALQALKLVLNKNERGRFHDIVSFKKGSKEVNNLLIANADPSEFAGDDWNDVGDFCARMLSGLKGQHNSDLKRIHIYHVEMDSPGGGIIKYQKDWSLETAIQYSKEWFQNGRSNTTLPGSTPSIRNTFDAFKLRFKIAKGKVESTFDHPLISLAEAYEFYYGNQGVARKIARIYGQTYIRYLISALRGLGNRTPWKTLGNLFVLSGMILHKIGRHKEVYMNEWPYLIGRLTRLGESVERSFFLDRDRRVPLNLRASELAVRFESNPRGALDGFLKWFKGGYLGFIHTKRPKYYQLYCDIFVKLTGQDIPTSSTPEQRIELMQGYCAKLDFEEDKTPTETNQTKE